MSDYHPERAATSLPRISEGPADLRRLTAIISEHLGLAPNLFTGKQLVMRGFLQYRQSYADHGTVSEGNQIVGVTAPGKTITLATSLLINGGWVRVVNEFAGVGTTTVETEGAETINGLSSYSLVDEYDSVLLYSDGSNWFAV